MNRYEIVIGLEIHIQLATKSKMFCGCSNVPTEPNMQLCPVCLGLPGALPVPNERAIRATQMLAAAVGATLAESSRFDRKHYFYPDLPKGYQISQYQHPLAEGGSVQIEGREVGIERLHLEEDAGKNTHRSSQTLVDLNRAGTPLVELVTKPDLRSPAEARAFLQQLQELVRILGVGQANMEKGELRVDANVSLHEPGTPLGAKVEIKNMNSLRFLERALNFEVERQTKLLEAGESVTRETRGFVEKTGETTAQRSKEEAQDYRYMPEPDIPPLKFSTEELEQIRREVRDAISSHRGASEALAGDRARRLSALHGMGLTNEVFLDDNLMGAMRQILGQVGVDAFPRGIESVITRNIELQERLQRGEAETVRFIADLVRELGQGSLVFSQAQQVTADHLVSGDSLSEIIARLGLDRSMDLESLATQAIAENPRATSDYRAGNERALAALVGAIMKASGGTADPAEATRLLKEKLGT